MAFLFVAMHEIGHLATYEYRQHVERCGDDHEGGVHGYPTWDHYCFVEGLADDWTIRTMAKIRAADDRAGMPCGRLTGYPGALVSSNLLGNGGRPWGNEFNRHRIKEWRALCCGAQVTLEDVINDFWGRHHIVYRLDDPRLVDSWDWEEFKENDDVGNRLWRMCRARIRREIHAVARHLGITRQFTNKAGTRRYLMFNAGEADRVAAELDARQEGILHWIDARVRQHWPVPEGVA